MRSPSLKRTLVALVALSVFLSATAIPAAATSGSVELDRALENQQRSDTVSFAFTADRNGSVSADDVIRTDGGNVEFEFRGWSGGGQSGYGSTWDVSEGERYTVEYEATARSGASETTHYGGVSIDYRSGGTATSESLSLEVDYLDPRFGTIGYQSAEVLFDDDSDQSTTIEVDVPNVGEGVMVVEDVSPAGAPTGIDASAISTPDRIDGNDDEELELRIDVDESVAAGSHEFEVTVSDSLGSSETFTVDVEVKKPPIAGVPGDTVDVGDVLVGSERTVMFEVEERGRNQGLNGIETTVDSSDRYGSISISEPWRFGTSPGGSDEARVTMTVDEDAPQHRDLEFDVLLSGEDRDSPETSVTFTGRVIYPASLDDLRSSPGTLVFDRPRSEVNHHTLETDIRIRNSGDLDMDVRSVTATVSHRDISATVENSPSVVGGQETEYADINVQADPSVPEGTYELQITVRTDDAGSETIVREFDVVHETELDVEETDVQFGEVTITDRITRSIDVSEELEYKDVENVNITVVDGPDQWLEITSKPPSTLIAGESAPLVFELQFDTEAQAYQEYAWTVKIDGDEVEAKTIEVRATARLLSVEDIVTDLDDVSDDGGWQGETASTASSELTSIERRLREGESMSNGDIWRSLTIGQSTVILLDAVDSVESQQADGNYEAAQSEVVSALVARNLIETYVDELEDPDTASSLREVVDRSEGPVDEIVAEQERHYETILNDPDSTALERYRASNSLATLSAHQGDDGRAAKYETTAEAHFEEYQRLTDTGVDRRQRARDAYRAFESNATLTVFGQPLVLNPARIDEVSTTRESVTADYAISAESFEEAGASAEARSADAEGSDAATELRIAEYGLYGASVASGVGFAYLILREVLNAVAYARELREAASGDFLL